MPSQALPDFYFSLLGPTAMAYGGNPFEVSRKQNRALLYCLAAQTTPVPRAHLAFLFWPDEADAHSRRLLTQLLSHIRRILPDPSLLIVNPEYIQLAPRRTGSDAASFDALCQNVATASIEDLSQAATLYAGPFLDGFSLPQYPEYESWIANKRAWLEQLYLDVLRRLLDHSIALGQHQLAIKYAQRYLATDGIAEEIHCQLMMSYAAVGERSAALVQYAHCARILNQELGVSPLPATNALYQMIRTGNIP